MQVIGPQSLIKLGNRTSVVPAISFGKAAMNSKQVLDLDRYIPALLTFASNKLAYGAAAKYKALFGIGMAEWRVMALLAAEPHIAANRICQVIGVDKALVSRVVQKLASQDLVIAKVDQRNSSRYVISLTPAGERVHDQIIQIVFEREKILLSAFTKEEIDTLVEMLHRIHKQADIVNAYEPPSGKTPRKPASRRQT